MLETSGGMPVRIIVVTTSFPAHSGDPSGHFVATEARELASSGHGVTVVAPTTAAPGHTPWAPASVAVEGAGGGAAFGWPGVLARVRAKPWRIVAALRFVFAARRALHRLAAQEPVERVLAHWAVPCAWPIGAGVAPIIAVSHGADVRLLRALPRVVRSFVVGRLLRAVVEWRFVSEGLRAALVGVAAAGVGRGRRGTKRRVGEPHRRGTRRSRRSPRGERRAHLCGRWAPRGPEARGPSVAPRGRKASGRRHAAAGRHRRRRARATAPREGREGPLPRCALLGPSPPTGSPRLDRCGGCVALRSAPGRRRRADSASRGSLARHAGGARRLSAHERRAIDAANLPRRRAQSRGCSLMKRKASSQNASSRIGAWGPPSMRQCSTAPSTLQPE